MDSSEGQSERKSCDTDRPELLPRNPVNLDEARAAWHCDFCGFYVYSTKDGYPTKGAPIARYYSTAYQSVCAVCHALVNNPSLVTDYWRGLQREWEKKQKELKDKYDGLTGRKDYFTGL